MTSGQFPPLSQWDGGCRFVSLARATPWGLVWTHISRTHSQVKRPPFHRSNVCLGQLGRFPSQMSVLCNWADSQVRCLSCATGRSGHSTVRLWTTHIRSNHTAVRSLGQMSVSCSWASQPPGTHIHTYQAHTHTQRPREVLR